MLSNSTLKKRLKNKELTFGSWLSFGEPLLAEMMAKSGFDWLVVDMEHSGSSTAQMQYMIQVIELAGVAPMVRVGANDPLLIKRALDAGAHGIIVPMVCSVEDAKQAVEAVYYPPVGKRGVGLSRAQDFGMGFDDYKKAMPDKAVLIVQIEHIDAVNDLENILNVEGVDGFIIGPYDLSGSVGKPGEFDDPEVKAALDKAQDVLKSHKKPGGYHIVHSDQDAVQARIDAGARFIAYGTEMIFLAEKLKSEGSFLDQMKQRKDLAA